MKQVTFELLSNREISRNTFELRLRGDTSAISCSGQFVNIKLDGFFLRRPLSVCDLDGDVLTLIYKSVGKGTQALTKLPEGTELDVLTGLGNGFNLSSSGEMPLLIGGGTGVSPMFLLAKELTAEGKKVTAVLGFNSRDEVFYEEKFRELGAEVRVTTVDGSYGTCGFVTAALPEKYSYTYACGPEPMLEAVWNLTETSGQYSFEERMGCGFGACMGCSCKTKYGSKRICKDGPVLTKEEIIWQIPE